MKQVSTGFVRRNSLQTLNFIQNTGQFMCFSRKKLTLNLQSNLVSEINNNSNNKAPIPAKHHRGESLPVKELRKYTKIELLHSVKKKKIEHQQSMRAIKAKLKQNKQSKLFLNQIQMTIEESKRLKEEIFENVERDPKPSDRAIRLHNKYEKVWTHRRTAYNKKG